MKMFHLAATLGLALAFQAVDARPPSHNNDDRGNRDSRERNHRGEQTYSEPQRNQTADVRQIEPVRTAPRVDAYRAGVQDGRAISYRSAPTRSISTPQYGRSDNRYENHHDNRYNNRYDDHYRHNGYGHDRGYEQRYADRHPAYRPSSKHYQYARYRAPSHWSPGPGWIPRPWYAGHYLPTYYYQPSYYVDYSYYQLPPPPYGHRWVRHNHDILLVALTSGFILDVWSDFFF